MPRSVGLSVCRSVCLSVEKNSKASKLHDRAEIEQNSENQSDYSIRENPKKVLDSNPTPKIAH